MCLNSLLIKAHGKNIIVDVGMGNKLDPKTQKRWHLTHPYGTLIDGLARLGLSPQDIHLVIDTHLHGDHCEMNTMFGADGTIVATFPNAEYVVQRREYDEAMNPNERTRATYVSLNYEPLKQSGQLRLLEGDTELMTGIQGVVTPGHTPAHMSVIVHSGDEYLFFICDLASYAVHFQHLAWMTAYDVEPLVTLETKRYWQRWAADHNAIVVFPHDTTMMAARLHQTESHQFTLAPLTEADGACYA
jgi:glyoxylase-like metal-dependent hydrolase (beta-lactamase superfamily II)